MGRNERNICISKCGGYVPAGLPHSTSTKGRPNDMMHIPTGNYAYETSDRCLKLIALVLDVRTTPDLVLPCCFIFICVLCYQPSFCLPLKTLSFYIVYMNMNLVFKWVRQNFLSVLWVAYVCISFNRIEFCSTTLIWQQEKKISHCLQILSFDFIHHYNSFATSFRCGKACMYLEILTSNLISKYMSYMTQKLEFSLIHPKNTFKGSLSHLRIGVPTYRHIYGLALSNNLAQPLCTTPHRPL